MREWFSSYSSPLQNFFFSLQDWLKLKNWHLEVLLTETRNPFLNKTQFVEKGYTFGIWVSPISTFIYTEDYLLLSNFDLTDWSHIHAEEWK